MSSEETPEQNFERMGVEKVRTLVHTAGLPTQLQLPAINWLAQRDEEARLRNLSSQSEQIEIARSAKDAASAAARAAERAAVAAEHANTMAKSALAIAIISIAATIIGIWIVHRDTLAD